MRHWMRWRLAELRVKGGSAGAWLLVVIGGQDCRWVLIWVGLRGWESVNEVVHCKTMVWVYARLYFGSCGIVPTTTGGALDVHVKVWSDLQHVCMNGPSQVSQKILQHDVSLAFRFIPPDCSIFCILLYNIYRLAYKLLFTILQTLEKQVLWYAMMMILCGSLHLQLMLPWVNHHLGVSMIGGTSSTCAFKVEACTSGRNILKNGWISGKGHVQNTPRTLVNTGDKQVTFVAEDMVQK